MEQKESPILTMTTKQVIQSLKSVYDKYGVNEVGEIFVAMAEQGKEGTQKEKEQVARGITFLTDVLYKIDTCESDCFDNIENKNIINCGCNGEPFVLPLKNHPFKVANA
jgi:hypothetical protein